MWCFLDQSNFRYRWNFPNHLSKKLKKGIQDYLNLHSFITKLGLGSEKSKPRPVEKSVVNWTMEAYHKSLKSKSMYVIHFDFSFMPKVCLFPDNFSVWLKSPKIVPKNYPKHYPTKEKMVSIVIWHRFGEMWARWKTFWD